MKYERELGLAEGRAETLRSIVNNLKGNGFSEKDIKDMTGLSIDEIREI